MKATIQIFARMMFCGTLLCCGLDPDLAKIPVEIVGTPEERVLKFLQNVVRVTSSHVCAYKAQKAFFDLLSGGHEVLREIITFIHDEYPGIPVLIDCKIGDVENTMATYVHNLFEVLGADGVLVNPYLGDGAVLPLAEYKDKAVVVLAKTSNPSGSIVQDTRMADGRMLWEYILHLIVNRWNRNGNMVPVVSSTAGLNMAIVRNTIPNNMPILLAGVGAQGGNYSDLRHLLNQQGVGVFVGSSRGILYPPPKPGKTWLTAVEEAAVTLKDSLNAARGLG